jgi:PKD repeat protein
MNPRRAARRIVTATLVAAALVAGVALAEPKPDFSFSPESPTVGQTVTFTADDPCDPPVVCTWQFGDDGVAEPGRIVTHAYSAPGRVTATLTADDPDDGIDATPIPRTIDVLPVAVPNSPPVAAFSVTPSAPSTGEIVQFDSSASSDPDGALIRDWDLDGNGSFETGDLVKPFRSYADDGTITVSLRVTDEDGASVTVEQEVAVQASQVAQAPMTLLGPAGGLPVLLPAAPLTPVVLAAPRLLTPFPVVRFAGALSARGARLTLFTVRAPKGARIAASCRGAGCPPALAVRAAGLKRLPALQRAYRAGVRIEVRIMKPNRIGKYVRITIRKGEAPARKDACLWPGSRAPRACP